MAPIERITLFNIPKEEDRQILAEKYKELVKTALKDGKPYIRNASSGPGFADPRSQGYNFGVKATFDNMEDFNFYDADCESHKAIKAFVGKVKIGEVLMLYYENTA